ncbi:hypothetical protein HAX54_000660 [Datura stramonium]|uniref:Uncharacterized protein n=1 Tax=Datura stramonium TaxID=4076 RepID=A0ABS8RS43_DATST|nr:hypothetical protein [Datura stramonium]
MTITEAIRSLVDFYCCSQYCYLANEQVEELSKVVRYNRLWLLLAELCDLLNGLHSALKPSIFNVGTKYTSIQARGALAAFIFGFMTFMSIGGFPLFGEDMKVCFQRERMKGHYDVTAFVISNMLSAMLFLIWIASLSAIS